jgi:hypothetical protein
MTETKYKSNFNYPSLKYLLTCYSVFCLSLEAFLVILVSFQLSSWFFEQSVQAEQISVSTILCPPGFDIGPTGNCGRETIQFPSQLNPCPPGFSVDSSGLCEQIQTDLETDQEEQRLQPEPSLIQSPDFTTYRNDSLGTSIQYPIDWELVSNVPFFDYAFFVEESAGVGVKIVNVPSPINLDQIYASTYALLPYLIPEFQLVSASETTFLGNPAFSIIFEGFLKEYDKNIQVQTTFTVLNNRLYSITYFAFPPFFEDHRSVTQFMINSFEIF